MTLRFRADGTFTIAQFTDLHWRNGEPKDLETRETMRRVIEWEKPDLVVLTGDVLAGGGCEDPAASLREAVRVLEENGVHWAMVFGNHDDEGKLSREALMDVQQSQPHCLSQRGPVDVSGVGNYTLIVESRDGQREPAAVLYFIDSNAYSELEGIDGYGWIRPDQIDWYRRTAAELGQAGPKKLPALAFFHIPLPEYEEAVAHETFQGAKNERVCAPKVNSGFFFALREVGDVLGTFVGHDHTNDYDATVHGIRLCYGRGSGYQTYGKEGFPKGSRLMRLIEGERTFDTWLRLSDGTIVER